MIIGQGDIASALREVDRDDLLFFASGVSNSQEIRDEAYEREKKMLVKYTTRGHIVYFSSLSIFCNDNRSLSIFCNDNRYVRHKKEMEELVRNWCLKYTILRLGNITWGDNPHTLINFIRNKIKNNEPFEIRDEYRYIVDKDEFLHWIKLIPDWSCEMNIPGKRLKVRDVVDRYCRL